jgi:hypothetical protein
MRTVVMCAVLGTGCVEAEAPLQSPDASAPSLDASSPGLDAAPSSDAARSADAHARDARTDSTSCGAAAVSAHACLHGRDGPFRVVEQELADVSRPHTLFTVRSERVQFTPGEPGPHALFLRGTLRSAQQAEQALALVREPSGCDVLPALYVLTAHDGSPVELTLAGESVALVIEPLAPWSCAAPGVDAGSCRSRGPCSSDDECCSYCHDYDHCH